MDTKVADSEHSATAPGISQADFNRIILLVLAAGLIVLTILGSGIVWFSFKSRDFNHWVDHTHVAERQIVVFQAAVERLETTRRGYLLGPTPQQLSLYQAARQEREVALYQLANTTSDNPVQRANVDRLRPLLAWKNKLNDDSVELVRNGGQAAAIRAFPTEQSMQPLLGIRTIVANMLAEEARLLGARQAQEDGAIGVLMTLGLAAAVLLALLAIASILVMRRFTSDLAVTQGKLEAANEGLELRVTERTADLTRANEEIQRFAYIVSHDLRSPLVNVMGFTSELEAAMKPLRALVKWIEERDTEGRLPAEVKTAVDADIPEAIGFIRSSTRKMDGLIGAILKLSREGRRILRPERLAMEPLVETLITTIQHRLNEVEGEAVVSGVLPDIVSDRLAVEQVIGNLLDNAVKYRSPNRPLRIAVSGSASGARVTIEVADNGRGVDPKDHERIFELFRRSGAQTQVGEGIGLAHVRALAHRLGGTVTCTSALDQGAVFRLSLPKVLVIIEGSPA
jgi:signal transduction histidine kinase